MTSSPRCIWVLPALLVLFSLPTFAAGSPDRTQIGHDIRVEAGQSASDLTCINCSVYIAGNVAGDVTTLNGRVVLEGAGQVAGDVTTVVGDVRAESGTKIAGDLTVFGGALHRAANVQIAGDVTELRGTGWVALIFAIPLFILGVVVALIVWLLQRNRHPAPIAARV